jgi:hypothetical protein
MTNPELTPLNSLGGNHGGYRHAHQTAPSDPVEPSGRTDERTRPVASGTCFSTGRTYSIEDAGIRAGELIGFRAWTLDCDGFLHSMFKEDYVWRPSAIHRSGVKRAAYGEGLHAFKTLQEAKDHYLCYWHSYTVVFGEVALWGEVIEHERGYRAQFAAVRSIISTHCFTRDYGYRQPIHWRFWRPRAPSPRETQRRELHERYAARVNTL